MEAEERGRMNFEGEFEGKLEALHLEPGDILVIRFPGVVPPYELRQIEEFLAGYLPDIKLLILMRGAELDIVRPPEE